MPNDWKGWKLDAAVPAGWRDDNEIEDGFDAAMLESLTIHYTL